MTHYHIIIADFLFIFCFTSRHEQYSPVTAAFECVSKYCKMMWGSLKRIDMTYKILLSKSLNIGICYTTHLIIFILIYNAAWGALLYNYHVTTSNISIFVIAYILQATVPHTNTKIMSTQTRYFNCDSIVDVQEEFCFCYLLKIGFLLLCWGQQTFSFCNTQSLLLGLC